MNKYFEWATEEDIKNKCDVVDINKGITKSGIPLASFNGKMYVNTDLSHNLIIGSTGSGKTQSIILPMLRLSMMAKESFVINDPNKELFKLLGSKLKEEGYNTILLDFDYAKYGNNWNPLKEIYRQYKNKNHDISIKMIEDFAYYLFYEPASNADPFWINTTIDYFTGLVLYLFEFAKEDEMNLQSVYSLNNIINTKGNSEKIMDELDKNSEIYLNLAGTLKAPPETRGSILSVFNQKIKRYISRKNITNLLSGNDFEIDEIFNKPTAIFIASENSNYSSNLIPLFITQIIEKAKERNNERRMNLLLDEFDSMVPIKDFTRVINYCRSINIILTITIQSYAHLAYMYKDEINLLRYCFGNMIYLLSEDIKTLEEVSKSCGMSKNGPLITIEELKLLKPFEAVITIPRMMPIKTMLLPDYKIDWGYEVKKEEIPLRNIADAKIYEK